MNKAQAIALFLLASFVGHAQSVNNWIETYTPGDGIRQVSRNGYETALSFYMQPGFEYRTYTDPNSELNLNRFRMRRLRMRIQGSSENHKMGYRVQYDFSGNGEIDATNSVYLLDAFVFYKPTKRIDIEIGKRATPTDNRELWMLSHTTQFVERSRLTSAFAAIREVGIFANGNFRMKRAGGYLRPYVAVTTGDGDALDQRNYGGLKVGGRLDYLPFGLFTYYGQFRQVDMVRENTPKLVVGVVSSYNAGMSSRRGRESGSILYLDGDLQPSLPNYLKIGADFMLKYRGFSAIGEFVHAQGSVPTDLVYRVRNDGSLATTFLVNGLQDPTNYVLGRMMVGQGYNLQAGYLLRNGLSLDLRYTQLVPAQHSFLTNGTFYNRPLYYTASVGKYFSRNYSYSVRASVTRATLAAGSNDIYGAPVEGHEWIFRLLTTYAF